MKLLPDLDRTAHILAVDDDANLLKLTLLICERSGFVCHTVLSGMEAISTLSKVPNHFDVILMDTMMPGMHGIEATTRIRQLPDAQHYTIVICTSSGSVDELVRALESGADEVYPKPYHPHDLVERLAEWAMYSRMRRVWNSIPDDDRFNRFFSHAAADEDIMVRAIAAEWLVQTAQTSEERAQVRGLLELWQHDLDDRLVFTANRLIRQVS